MNETFLHLKSGILFGWVRLGQQKVYNLRFSVVQFVVPDGRIAPIEYTGNPALKPASASRTPAENSAHRRPRRRPMPIQSSNGPGYGKFSKTSIIIPMRNSSFRKIAPVVAVLVILSAFTPRLCADEGDELKQLRDQLHALEQKILVLEHKQELKDQAAAATPPPPRITVNDKGFTLASADGDNSIRLRGLAQLDSRLFFGDNGVVNNAFVLRRARLITEGFFARNYSFQFVTEFAGSTVSILDANLGVTVDKALQLKFGKFKPPVGLELLQSDSWTFFNERSIVTNLVPNRDLGVQAGGDLFNGTVNYAAGIFGGVADGASTTNSDFDNDKDVVARIFATPFKNSAGSPVQGLSFGLSASQGHEKTAAGRTAGYKTDGQQTFFSYNAATIADGQSWRVSPQFDYRHGPLGVIGEYVLSTVNLRPSAIGAKVELQNKAWQLAAGYVLTGEASAFTGVVPKVNFDFANGTWGAFEVTGRYSNLKIDDAAFPLYASNSTNADEATSYGLGLNWYLSKAVALKIDYYQTKFGFAPGAPAISTTPILRQDEETLITRFQVSF
jgi:phosphate-selective porin OprO/OprP